MLTCKDKKVEGSRLIPLADSSENICSVNIYFVSIHEENKSIRTDFYFNKNENQTYQKIGMFHKITTKRYTEYCCVQTTPTLFQGFTVHYYSQSLLLSD